MKKVFLFFTSFIFVLSLSAQISGTSTPQLNTQYTYTFNNGSGQLGGVTWTATNGTIHSTSSSGTAYSASISFSSSGSKTITVKNGFSGATLATKTVTVANPPLVAGSIGNAQTVCYNGNPSTLTNTGSASGGSGSYSYQWQKKCIVGGCSWSNISGATSTTYNPPVLTSTTDYRRRVISGGSTKYTNQIRVTVRPNLGSGTIGNAQTLCYNGNPSTLSNSSSAHGGNGSYSYQWQISTNGSSGWSNISGATSSTYNPPALTSSRWYRRRVSSCGQTRYTSSVKVTIHPNLSAGSISNAQTLCYNGNPSTLTNSSSASGGDGNRTYQWQISSNGTSGWSNISGATGSTYNPPSLTSSKWYRRRVISCGQTKYTGTVKVTIHPNLSAGSIGNAQTLCYNGNPSTLTNTGSASGGNGSITYQWQYSTNGLNGYTNISGATGTTYNPGALTSNRWYRRRAISCGQTKYTTPVKITIHPNLSAGSIGNAQTLCYNGNPATLSNSSSASGGNGSITYQWQISTNGSSGWSNISGATGSTYNPPTLTSSRWYRRRAISCGQTKYTGTVKVTIHPNLSAGSISNAQTLCYNSNPSTLTNTSSASGGNGSRTYQWQISTNGSSWSNISGATGTTYDPPTLTSSRWYRRRVISCGQTKYTGTVKVTIHPALSVGVIGNAQTLCYNGNPSALSNVTSASGGNGTINYQWESRPIGGSWSDVGGATSATYDPPALTASREYRRKASSCGQTLHTLSTVTVTVHPNLSAGSIGNAQTLCYNGNPSALTNGGSASGGDGNLSYQWEQSTNGTSGWTEISGATNSTYDPGALTSSRWYRRRVNSCTQEKYTSNVKVTIRPTLNPGSIGNAQTLCYNSDPSALTSGSTASGGDGSYAYQWQYSTNGTSGWTDVDANGTSATYDPGTLTESMWYRREVTSCGETKETDPIKVTIHPQFTSGAISNNDQTVCFEENPAMLSSLSEAEGGDGTLDYQWESRLIGGSWSDVSGATSASYDPPVLEDSREYRRKVTSCGVTLTSFGVITVTVRPDLDPGSIGGDQTLCNNGDPVEFSNDTPASGGDDSYDYQWEISTNGTTGWTPLSGNTLATYDAGALSSSRWYRRSVTSCGQTKHTNTVWVDVHDPLSPGTLNDQTICSGTVPGALGSTAPTGGDNTYEYMWEVRPEGGSWFMLTDDTTQTYQPGFATTDLEYRRTVTSCGQTIASNVASVAIYDPLSAPYITSSQTICYNEDAETLQMGDTPQGADGNYTYQWQVFNSTWQDISGADTTTYTPTANTSSADYRLKVSSCFEEVFTNAVKISVLDQLGFAGYISGPTHVDSLASGTLTLGSGSVSANWFSSTDEETWTSLGSGSSYNFTNISEDTYFRAEVTNGQCVNTSDGFLVKVLSTVNDDIVPDNYVTSHTLLVPETDEQNIGILAFNEIATTFSYFDGLGRTVQQVSKGSTPSGHDMISFATFDPLDLESKQYLPYVSEAGTDYRADPVTEQGNYYTSPSANVASSSAPYAVSIYEASPRKLLLEQGAPGTDWQPGNGHTVTQGYRFNTAADAVLRFDASDLSQLSDYSAGVLNRVETTDENGHKVRRYTDSRGLTVMKEVELSAGVFATTVNVHDQVGKLRYVLSPNAVDYIQTNASWTIGDIEDLILEYKYDVKGRLIERKIPGKGWEYLVYDPWDRVALTQDAIMRENDQWSFTKTDRRGRPLYSGLYIDSSTRSQLQDAFDTLNYDGGADPYYETRGDSIEGYSNTVFPTANLEVHTVNYYDDYDFDRNDVADYTLNTTHLSGQDTTTISSTRNLPTGSKTRILGTNDWLVTVNFYDEDGRVIQSVSNNAKRLTVDNLTTNIYNTYSGELTKNRSTVNTGDDTVEQDREYTYDSRKRLKSVKHSLDRGVTWVMLDSLNYNEIGQLAEKNLFSPSGGGQGEVLQSIDYSYTIRGWLQGINDTDLSDGEGDVFGMELVYNDNDSELSNTQQYNGNISGMKWSNYDAQGEGVSERGYAYGYDHADRLLAASQKRNNGTWGATAGYSVSGTQYDPNGNITSLERNDANGSGLDDLTYQYNGNQLMQVADAADSLGFADGSNTGDDFAYDVNGNMIKDLNKGVDTIYYNHLDLPTTVILSDSPLQGGEGGVSPDSLTYTYTATGGKLGMKVWKDGIVEGSVDYVGGIRYEDGDLHSIMHEEGRIISKKDKSLIFINNAGTTSGFSSNQNVTKSSDGTRVRVITNQSNSTPGVWPINGTISVSAGEKYQFKIKGYSDEGVGVFLYVSTNLGNLIWKGNKLPEGAGNEGWVSNTFEIPVGATTLKVGALFVEKESGDSFYIDQAELYKIESTDTDYQYTLKDHQGNTRRVLSTLHEVYTSTETFESGESNGFAELHRHTSTDANTTPGGNEVELLQSGQAGALVMFRLDKGDTVDLKVQANYEGTVSGNTFISTGYNALFNAWDGVYGSGAEGGVSGGAPNEFDDALTNGMTGKDGTSDAPRAFLNYIFFDLNMNFESAGFQQISTAAQGIGVHEQVEINDIIANHSGYLLAYLSNENSEAVNIHFDDFEVRHAKTNVVQSVDYYPFGLEAMTYTRTAADPTKYLYNGGVEKNDYTTYYETFYRNYDASIGRFTGVDIAAAKYSSLSPYQYAFNDPVYWNDPLGDDGCPSCPQESPDYRMDPGGGGLAGMEFNTASLYAGAAGWSINTGSLFNGGLIQRGQWDLANSEAMMGTDQDKFDLAKSVAQDVRAYAKYQVDGQGNIVGDVFVDIEVNGELYQGVGGENPQVLHASLGDIVGGDLWNMLSNINNGVGFVVGGASESLGKTIHARAEVRNLVGWNKTTGGSLDKVLIKGVPVNRSLLNGAAKTLRVGGSALGVLGVGMTVYEISEGQKSLVGEGGLDLIMGGVAFIPGGGWIVSGAYFGGKYLLEYTGNDFWND